MLSGTLGGTSRATKSPQGVIVLSLEGFPSLCEQRGEDDPTGAEGRVRDRFFRDELMVLATDGVHSCCEHRGAEAPASRADFILAECGGEAIPGLFEWLARVKTVRLCGSLHFPAIQAQALGHLFLCLKSSYVNRHDAISVAFVEMGDARPLTIFRALPAALVCGLT